MGIQPVSLLNNPKVNQITSTIKKASQEEKTALCNALGINKETIKSWRTKFETRRDDITDGEILPNISVTAKGISPIETIANIANVELARIRGQLKKVSPTDLNI